MGGCINIGFVNSGKFAVRDKLKYSLGGVRTKERVHLKTKLNLMQQYVAGCLAGRLIFDTDQIAGFFAKKNRAERGSSNDRGVRLRTLNSKC